MVNRSGGKGGCGQPSDVFLVKKVGERDSWAASDLAFELDYVSSCRLRRRLRRLVDDGLVERFWNKRSMRTEYRVVEE